MARWLSDAVVNSAMICRARLQASFFDHVMSEEIGADRPQMRDSALDLSAPHEHAAASELRFRGLQRLPGRVKELDGALHEPDCEVKERVERGELNAARYETCARLWNDLA